MKEIEIRSIIEITDDKILYRDNEGNTAFIELAPCADNFYHEYPLAKPSDTLRCVGDRRWCVFTYGGRLSYYILYTTEEHTLLYLELKTNPVKQFIEMVFGWNFYSEEFKLFYSVQKRLAAHGWTTYDTN